MTKEQLEKATELKNEIDSIDETIKSINNNGVRYSTGLYSYSLHYKLDENVYKSIEEKTIQALKNKRKSLQSKFNKIK